MKTFHTHLLETFAVLVPNFMLLENRIEFLKKTYPTLDTEHDSHGEHKDAGAIIQHFADKADPTRNKAHTQWIVGQYAKKNIRQEDAPRINTALSNFEKHKNKLSPEQKQISNKTYPSVSHLEDVVAPHLGTASTKKEAASVFDTTGTSLKYEDEHVAIHRLHTKEGAKNAGKGTDWCTANEDDDHNMFDHYNDKSKYPGGDIYTVIDKKNKNTSDNPKYRGQARKYQFHSASNQFMNERDDPISKEEFESIKPSFHAAITKHPEMVDADKL